jgi:hypothetical protein
MIDVPPAIATARNDGSADGILERTALKGQIDSRIGNRASEIPSQDGAISGAHDGVGRRPKGSYFLCTMVAILPNQMELPRRILHPKHGTGSVRQVNVVPTGFTR